MHCFPAAATPFPGQHNRPVRSQDNFQPPHYVPWQPEPLSTGTDAFTLDWRKERGNACPLRDSGQGDSAGIRAGGAITGDSYVEEAAWFPPPFAATVAPPSILPAHPNLFQDHQGAPHPLVQGGQLRLCTWLVSGLSTHQQDFEGQCRSYSSPLGGQAHPGATTVFGQSGVAGVLDGRWIQLAPSPRRVNNSR